MSKTTSVFMQINDEPVIVFSKDQETTERFNNLRFKAKETCSEFLDEELEENLVSAFPKPCEMSSMTELCDLIKDNLKTKIDDSFKIKVLPKTNNPIVHRTECVKITRAV